MNDTDNNTSNYPRVYQPSALFAFGFGFIFPTVVIFVAAYLFLQQGGFASLDGRDVLYVLLLIIVYFSIIRTIGYRVTLRPEAIEVTTLLGTKKMFKVEIEFYKY